MFPARLERHGSTLERLSLALHEHDRTAGIVDKSGLRHDGTGSVRLHQQVEEHGLTDRQPRQAVIEGS